MMDEFTIRLASKPEESKTSVFRMHKDDDVSWKDARMKRENDYQPWQIKLGSGKSARNFKAIKDGGVGDNTSYYVLYKNDPNSKVFEACPVDDWYSMSATQRYKTLTAEEAEEKFEKRHKMFNLFSVMGFQKGADDGGETEMSNGKDFKVSEFDEWNQSGDDEASDQEGEDGDESKRKVRRKKGVKKDEAAPAEGKEESDEGDFEEREVDYMSDSSSSRSEAPGSERKEEDDVKGIAEEEGLRDLLSTEDEDEDNPDKVKKLDVKSFAYKSDPDGSDSDDTSDSDDYDVDDEKMDSAVAKDELPASLRKEMKQGVDASRVDQISKSSPPGNANKRKIAPELNTNLQPSPSTKRPCNSDNSTTTSQGGPQPSNSAPLTSSSSNAFERTIEGLIIKYLRRKPMTLKTLLKEILVKVKKLDKTNPVDSNYAVGIIGEILKRLKPDSQKINGEKYYSFKKD